MRQQIPPSSFIIPARYLPFCGHRHRRSITLPNRHIVERSPNHIGVVAGPTIKLILESNDGHWLLCWYGIAPGWHLRKGRTRQKQEKV